MPELPEVQTVVNELKNDLIADRIVHIKHILQKVLSKFKPNDIIIDGKENLIQDVTRRAKFIIIHFHSHIFLKTLA